MTLFLPKINEGCQGQPRTKRLPSLTGGWKSSYSSLLPVEGEIFFLTFPFIDQAFTLKFMGRAGGTSPHAIPAEHQLLYSVMKCFSNRRFDRSAPSSVSITDFAFVAGS